MRCFATPAVLVGFPLRLRGSASFLFGAVLRFFCAPPRLFGGRLAPCFLFRTTSFGGQKITDGRITAAATAITIRRGAPFRANIFVGGPPAMMLAAVMPLPEGLAEISFAGALGRRRMPLVTRGVQRSISNFFQNIRFPIILGNDLLQAKFRDAGSDTARFLVNTTVGVAGFFDPATRFGIDKNFEDFGQTLGYWGVPPGPYLVLPLLGPSSVRDGLGLVGDYPLAVLPFFVDQYILLGARVVLQDLPVFGGAQLRTMQRLFFANVHPSPLDSSGRVLLPEKLRKYAGIDKEVVMVGVADRAEIWDRARWQKFEAENDERFDDLDVVLVGDGGPGGDG